MGIVKNTFEITLFDHDKIDKVFADCRAFSSHTGKKRDFSE